jgi:hypothetical protein
MELYWKGRGGEVKYRRRINNYGPVRNGSATCKVEMRSSLRFLHLAAACLFLSRLTARFTSSWKRCTGPHNRRHRSQVANRHQTHDARNTTITDRYLCTYVLVVLRTVGGIGLFRTGYGF